MVSVFHVDPLSSERSTSLAVAPACGTRQFSRRDRVSRPPQEGIASLFGAPAVPVRERADEGVFTADAPAASHCQRATILAPAPSPRCLPSAAPSQGCNTYILYYHTYYELSILSSDNSPRIFSAPTAAALPPARLAEKNWRLAVRTGRGFPETAGGRDRVPLRLKTMRESRPPAQKTLRSSPWFGGNSEVSARFVNQP